LIDSKANTTGVSFHNYKIVRNGQFVYVADTSRRGDKIALAMNSSEDCIVSAIYTVFEVSNTKELLVRQENFLSPHASKQDKLV
jgi:type I restriction enzyme S subunit